MEISKLSDVTQETQVQTRVQTGFNLVGIVPIEDNESRFRMPWADCLMPIGVNYLAYERAVVEAAYAGCDSIWLVSHGGVGDLVRDRLGEWIREPSNMQFTEKQRQSRTKKIPIYYIKVQSAQNNVGGAILKGAQIVYTVHKKLSQWVAPDRYYVSFPLGIYPPETLIDFRKDVRNRNGFFLSMADKTIKNGERLGFTFNNNELIEFQKIYDTCVKGGSSPNLQDIFGSQEMVFWEKEVVEAEVPFYFDISSWDRYRLFLGSESAIRIVRPELSILPKGYSKTLRKWKRIYHDE